nr:hypothetical protein BaRGS_010313 [Batillaria attramentaria]
MEERRMEALRRVCTAPVPTLSAIAMMLDLDVKPDATLQQLVMAISKGVKDAEGRDHEETTLKVVESLTHPIQITQSAPLAHSVSLRRELKLDGVITGGKDSLSFISFTRQLDAAHRRGYPEHEIMDAVITAVSPELPLRRVLEASRLDLEGMKRLIVQFFREPSPAELFTQLTQGTQQSGESAAEFVMRMMDLRQRIKHSSHSAQYPASLVDQTFRQNVLTGLTDMEMRVGLQDVLGQASCSDEDIFTKVHALGVCTRERDTKVSALAASSREQAPTTVHCNQVQREDGATVQTEVAKLTGVLEQLVARIQVLEREQGQAGGPQSSRSRYRCRQCIQANNSRCRHCWRCGSSAHFERDCTADKGRSGNAKVSR